MRRARSEKGRAPDDQPASGIILCAEKNEVEVEFALKNRHKAIGGAEYQLQRRLPTEFEGRLPTARQLAAVVRETHAPLPLDRPK